ncbi:MAG: sugar transferase [Anaerolineae bacterium]|nr:sugar transferase [Anaerolineae bacterium]
MEQLSSTELSNQAYVLSASNDYDSYYYIKRNMDTLLASLALIFLSPVMIIIAVLIKLDSRGAVLFTQERVGARRYFKNGRVVWQVQKFRVYKFRTMVQNADSSLHQEYIKAFIEGNAEPAGPDGKVYKLTNDPRVTGVGKFLRKTSLDELPQLFNVLLGEMSLIGPRPVPVYEYERYEAWHRERLAALPGITGFWQVSGRCQVSFEEMIRMDIEYVRHQTLWLDLKILLWTIPAVVSGRGAE